MSLKLTHRVQAFLALLITTAFVVMGMTLMPAFAQISTTTDLPKANINPDTARSLTIHKYANPQNPTNLQHNGTKLDDTALTGLTPLDGVEFTVWKIANLDLTDNTNADWNNVSKLTANPDCSGAKIGTLPATVNIDTPFFKGNTQTDGSLSVTNPEIGAYLVCETGHGANKIVKKVAPFIVIMPMPKYDKNGTVLNEWNYDVHVYPKNEISEVNKTVKDEAAFQLGDVVDWTITVKIPTLDTNEKLKKLVVTDKLDENLTYDSVADVKVGTESLVTPAHYTITPPAAGPGGTVVLTLTEDGLVKAARQQGQNFSMVLKTKVTSVPQAGVITNQAHVNVHDGETDTDIPETKWGRLNLLKHVKGNTADVLAQAEFTVQPKKSTGESCVADDFAATNNPVIKVITNNSGVAVYKEGDYAGKPVDLKVGDYCVRETKAPSGYVLPDINDSKNWLKVTIKEGTATTANAQIPVPNDKPGFPELPITGSATQLALTLGGIAVLLTAAGVGFYNTRLRRAES